jgi:lia operon protein LiaG
MRKSVYIGLILVVAGVIGLFVAYQQGGLLSGFGTTSFEQRETLDLNGVNRVLISPSSADIILIESAGDTVEVEAVGQVSNSLLEKTKLIVKKSGDKLIIDIEQPKFFVGFNFTSLELNIAIPSRQWEEFKIETGSGRVQADQLAARKIVISSGSGRVDLGQVEAESMEFSLGSGDVRMNASADQIKGSTGSGNIMLESGELKEIKLETGSGNITVTADQLTGKSRLDTGSGNIKVLLSERPESLHVKSSNGLGSSKLEWDGYNDLEQKDNKLEVIFGNGDAELVAETGSGNFTLGKQ